MVQGILDTSISRNGQHFSQQREPIRHAAEGAALIGVILLGVLGKLGVREAWHHAWPLKILASSKNVGIVHFQVSSQEV